MRSPTLKNGRAPAAARVAVTEALPTSVTAAAVPPHRIIPSCANCGYGHTLHAGVKGLGPSLVPGVNCSGWKEKQP